MNKLYFEQKFAIEVEVEEVAQELAGMPSDVQGALFNEFFTALWKACGNTQYNVEKQVLYIADNLEEDTARWLIQLGRDALTALSVASTEDVAMETHDERTGV